MIIIYIHIKKKKKQHKRRESFFYFFYCEFQVMASVERGDSVLIQIYTKNFTQKPK